LNSHEIYKFYVDSDNDGDAESHDARGGKWQIWLPTFPEQRNFKEIAHLCEGVIREYFFCNFVYHMAEQVLGLGYIKIMATVTTRVWVAKIDYGSHENFRAISVR
jgi:hypothetical protein